jgi:hypothetical protein
MASTVSGCAGQLRLYRISNGVQPTGGGPPDWERCWMGGLATPDPKQHETKYYQQPRIWTLYMSRNSFVIQQVGLLFSPSSNSAIAP